MLMDSTDDRRPDSDQESKKVESATSGADSRAPEPPEEKSALESESEGSELLELENENKFLVEQLQRARAELENYKRRTRQERNVQVRRSIIEVFRGILPLFDDLERALRVMANEIYTAINEAGDI